MADMSTGPDWFDPAVESVFDPMVDHSRFWRKAFGVERIHVGENLIYASNAHGKFFDRVVSCLDRRGSVEIDHREAGYVVARVDSIEITAHSAPGPAPFAASRLEALLAAGASRVVFLNGAGSLRPDLPVGTLVLPTDLCREEGTSYHYAPADVRLTTSADLRGALRDALTEKGVPFEEGPHWTTDAMYRETPGKVRRYRDGGILSVEMELSALAAVARFHRRSLAALLGVTDIVRTPHEWYLGAEEALSRGAERAADAAVSALSGVR